MSYTNYVYMERIKQAVAAFFDFLQGIVAIAAIMVMIYLFIMSPQEISGSSMNPTFLNGEYILTNKVLYRFTVPKRGEVVIFKSPKNKDVDYIKRVIGLPGETIRLEGGQFFINNIPLIETYDYNKPVFGESYMHEGDEIIIPDGQYFLIGDNRPGSSDSREFGPIVLEDFIGKAFLRYWPTTKVGLVKQGTYTLEK